MRKLLCSVGLLGMLATLFPSADAAVVVVKRHHHHYYHRYYRHGRWVVVYR